MRRPGTALAALVLTVLAGGAHAAEMPPGALSCSGCHAAGAGTVTAIPALRGRDEGALLASMQAFRKGERPVTVMDRIMKGFSEGEMAALAAYFAAQK